MSRIPKYTAGMFKKKMPRFGASSIRMPGMPRPPKPRVKKFAEGGDTYSGEKYLEDMARDEYLRRNPQYRTPEPGLEGVYPETLLAPAGALRGLAKTAAEKKAAEVTAKLAKRQAVLARRGRPTTQIDPKVLERIRKNQSLTDKLKKELEDIKDYFKDTKIAPVPAIAPPEEMFIRKSSTEKKASGGKVRGCGCARRGHGRGKFV